VWVVLAQNLLFEPLLLVTVELSLELVHCRVRGLNDVVESVDFFSLLLELNFQDGVLSVG
jgi:hypothetical protein